MKFWNPHNHNSRFVGYARMMIWCAPIVLFLFLSSRYVVFSGTLSFAYNLKDETPYVRILPESRFSEPVKDEKNWYRTVLADPVYFDIRVPRKFETGEVVMVYSVPEDIEKADTQEAVEFGGVANREKQNMVFVPLFLSQVEALSWERLADDRYILFQRNSEYLSVEAFFAHPPEEARVMVYRTQVPEYEAWDGRSEALLSSHDFFLMPAADLFHWSEGGRVYSRARVAFDMSSLEISDHFYRFVWSLPGVNQSKDIRLHRFSVDLKRSKPTIHELFSKVRTLLRDIL